MKLKMGLCANCNFRQEIEIEDKFLTNDLTLENYLKFRFVNVNKCSNCNYVSIDIFEKIPTFIKSLISSQKYLELLNHSYMGKYKNLPDKEYLMLNINELMAFCEILEQLKLDDLLLSKTYAQIADLKYSIAMTYIDTKYMKDDEDLFDSYDELVEMLFAQSKLDNKKSLQLLKGKEIPDVFTKIFIAERLCFMGDYAQAKRIMDKILAKTKVSKNFLDYINNFLTEVQ